MTEGVPEVMGMSLPRVSLGEGPARGMSIQGRRPRAGRRIRSKKACLTCLVILGSLFQLSESTFPNV